MDSRESQCPVYQCANWGLEAFGKREAAYRLPIAFPGGGALAASIWPIADYQACDRFLNQLDRT